MFVDQFQDTVILSQANDPYALFLSNFIKDYQKWNSFHIIINLEGIHKLQNEELLELLPFVEQQFERQKSFVIVSDTITYEDAPETLIIVPTIQEAKDVIEMENIERDLGL
ncbi:MAG: ribonuclease Z [Flavobacteriaceae bacterium]|nr:ribonuclease Z [Flavobacteriaceae bacterium]NVJ72416.1 ribonuclease Z [Flavobacteriaceae bacterium]